MEGGSDRGLIITSRRTTPRLFPRMRKPGDNAPRTVLSSSSLSPEKNRLRTAPLSHSPHWASLRAHRRVKGAFSSMMMEHITRLHTAVSWWLSSLLACVCPRLSSLPLITHPHSHSKVPSQITPYCWRKIGLSSRRRGAFQHRHNGPDARQRLYVAHPQNHHTPPPPQTPCLAGHYHWCQVTLWPRQHSAMSAIQMHGATVWGSLLFSDNGQIRAPLKMS